MRNRRHSFLPSVVALCLALVVLLTGQPSAASSAGGPVVEHLRLRVPRQDRSAWLEAERRSWEPWLRQQKGYLGRDLYWDSEREEGVLLIRWADRSDWQSIATAEVERVQRIFEQVAREVLGQPGCSTATPPDDVVVNPFPLVFSGSLEPLTIPVPVDRQDQTTSTPSA